MIEFIAGAMVGACLGVLVMALMQITKEGNDDTR